MNDENYEDLVMPLHLRYSDLQSEYSNANTYEVARPTKALREIRKNLFEDHINELYRDAQLALRQDLLAHIYCQSHDFFEHLIIDVLVHMGYASRQRDMSKCLGKSHDGGVDGVIMADELGLDAIYLQAKRYKLGTSVPISHIRDFVGSLEARQASKGVFVTTGQFTSATKDFVRSIQRRVVLVDGEKLADLMIRHNIGVKVKQTVQFKELKIEYFKEMTGRVSAASQSR